MQEVHLKINSNGLFVKDAANKWVPADGKVLNNVIDMLKEGLPNRPELEVK